MVKEEIEELFPQVIGQRKAKSIIWRAFQGGRLAHSYLLYGPWGVGKDALALELAKAVNCQGERKPCELCQSCNWVAKYNHPDLMILLPLPKSLAPEEVGELAQKRVENPYLDERMEGSLTISIDAIREMEKWAAQRPFWGERRVVIISRCDQMTIPAANALLKSLEEPPPYLLYILTTSHPQSLPLTIRSRCQMVRLGKLSRGEIESVLKGRFSIPSSQAKLLSRLSQGSLGQALRLNLEGRRVLRNEVLSLLEEALWGDPLKVMGSIEEGFKGKERAKAKEIIEVTLSWYRDLLLISQGMGDLVTNEDLMERLREESGRISWVKIEESVARLREAQTAITLNANLRLVLLVLFLRLRRIVRDEGDFSDRIQGVEERVFS
jgi:DNA polymerase-3 subunit delta'